MKKKKLVKNDLTEPIPKEKKKKEKKEKKGKKLKVSIWAIILIIGIIGVTAILVFALYIIITAPEFNKDKLYKSEPTIIYYADGTEMTRYGNQNRILVTYDELPQVLIDAIVATEDSRFFQHTGLDVARFAKAFIGQILGNDRAGGASTLSMQVIKNDYTSREAHGIEGIIRKFTDIYMSIFKLESNYTKEEIMEFYVNTMWFSSDKNIYIEGGIFGVEQACQYFFGKSVSDLTLAEASVIAGMFQNARALNPYTNAEGITTRQNTVLKLMVQHGYITEEEKEAAQKIPVASLLVDHSKDVQTSSNSATVQYVVKQVSDLTKKNPYTTPMKIYTTIDKKVQDVVTDFEKNFEYPNEFLEEGVAITSTVDGSIVALSGGRKCEGICTSKATDIRRQPGSTAKIIFDYGPYLEYIPNSSTYSLFLDRPHSYSNGTPIKNASGNYLDLITMRTALSRSRNIPALIAFQTLEKEKGLEYIADFAHSLGINYGDTLYESASIGGFDGVSPLQMSAAYAAFGRGGYYIEPYIFTKVEYTKTGEVYEYKYEKKKVMSEETAYMITDILMTAAKNGIGGVSVSGTDIAAKSGTTNMDDKTIEALGISKGANNDAWNITYSPEYAIALWMGYDVKNKDYYLTSDFGDTWRIKMMRYIGSKVYSKNKKFTVPDGVISVTVEKETFPAKLPSAYTPSDMKITELFREGMEPTEVSDRYDKLANPTNGKYSYNGGNLTLTWDAIVTPASYDNDALVEHFNTYYAEYANEYYNRRQSYNARNIGTLGYDIYLKQDDGNLISLGRTENTSFHLANATSGTYVIKSAFSIFKANRSDGLNITVQTGYDSNIDDMIDDNNTNSNNSDNNNNNTSSSTDTGLE